MRMMLFGASCKACVKHVGCLLILLAAAGAQGAAQAQQTVGYVDTEHILAQMPEYADVQQKLDRLAQQWQAELETQQQVVDALMQEFQARELLYTDAERAERQQAIRQARDEQARLRERYFGPEGQLYAEQQRLMRPVQARVLTAVEQVARAEGYDYVFDKSSDLLFMFAREQYDLSRAVLEELGIDVEPRSSASN